MKISAKHLVGATLVSMIALLGQSQAAQAVEVNAWADCTPQTCATTAQVDNYNYYAQNTRRPQLAQTSSSMPYGRSKVAPANLALRAVGKNVLPPTRLTSFIAESGMDDDIYGHEGDIKNTSYSPISSGFDPQTDAGLTTGHPSDAPSVYAFPTLAPIH
jgi:hypothetical protein